MKRTHDEASNAMQSAVKKQRIFIDLAQEEEKEEDPFPWPDLIPDMQRVIALELCSPITRIALSLTSRDHMQRFGYPLASTSPYTRIQWYLEEAKTDEAALAFASWYVGKGRGDQKTSGESKRRRRQRMFLFCNYELDSIARFYGDLLKDETILADRGFMTISGWQRRWTSLNDWQRRLIPVYNTTAVWLDFRLTCSEPSGLDAPHLLGMLNIYHDFGDSRNKHAFSQGMRLLCADEAREDSAYGQSVLDWIARSWESLIQRDSLLTSTVQDLGLVLGPA